jgi:hypothetical protein
LGGAHDSTNADEECRLVAGLDRAEEDLERARRWAAKPLIRVEHPATAKRDQLVGRQTTPLTCGLRASAMRKETQPELNAPEVPTDLIVRDIHVHKVTSLVQAR